MNEKPVVELKHVSKKIGKKEIIHDLSFTIPAGHIIIQMTKEEIPSVNKHLMKCGIEIYSIQMKEETLEDKFLEITEERK